MMRFYVILVVVLVIAPAGSQVDAQTNEWSWLFLAAPNSQDPATYGWFGVGSGSQDEYDTSDSMIEPSRKVYFGAYHENGTSGWTGPTGFYSYDSKSVLPPQAGASHSWRFYVWADSTLPPGVPNLYLSFLCRRPWEAPPPDVDFELVLVSKPASIAEGPAVGTSWSLSGRTTWGSVSLPVYRSADGLTGYLFEFRATVIPEPSSLIALATCVVPFAGMARRRSRCQPRGTVPARTTSG